MLSMMVYDAPWHYARARASPAFYSMLLLPILPPIPFILSLIPAHHRPRPNTEEEEGNH